MQLPVDKTASFFVNTERSTEDMQVNVDVSCKLIHHLFVDFCIFYQYVA